MGDNRYSSGNPVRDRFTWTREFTPVLQLLACEYGDSEPFANETIAVASHLEYKTGVFIDALTEVGAPILVTGSEPYSTVSEVVTEFEGNPRVRLFVTADMTEEAWEESQHALLEESPLISFSMTGVS